MQWGSNRFYEGLKLVLCDLLVPLLTIKGFFGHLIDLGCFVCPKVSLIRHVTQHVGLKKTFKLEHTSEFYRV